MALGPLTKGEYTKTLGKMKKVKLAQKLVAYFIYYLSKFKLKH
jgi:hypothetical protein